jgi:hypothetical protein
MKFKKILSSGALFSAAMMSAQAAEEAAAEAATADEAAPEAVAVETVPVEEASALSGWVSLDLHSHFISYGANVWGNDTRDIGDELLFQPSAGLEYSFEDYGAVYVGVWADINSIGGGGVKHFSDAGGDVQEIDLWVGYYFSVGKFTFDVAYQSWLYSGSNGAENEGIIDFTVSYDMLFSPYILMHNRIEANGDQETGTMYEIGGTLYEGGIGEDFTYSFPVGLGFSPDDYHVQGEDGYAYSFIAANAAYALPIDALGAWDIHGGLTYYNTDKSATGNARSSYLTATVGLGLSF